MGFFKKITGLFIEEVEEVEDTPNKLSNSVIDFLSLWLTEERFRAEWRVEGMRLINDTRQLEVNLYEDGSVYWVIFKGRSLPDDVRLSPKLKEAAYVAIVAIASGLIPDGLVYFKFLHDRQVAAAEAAKVRNDSLLVDTLRDMTTMLDADITRAEMVEENTQAVALKDSDTRREFRRIEWMPCDSAYHTTTTSDFEYGSGGSYSE